MNSTEDLHSRLIDPVTTNTSPINRYIEPTTVTIIPKNRNRLIDGDDHQQRQTSRQISAKHLSMATISRQLRVRKMLQTRLARISNMMCFLGLMGIILMIIANEIIFHSINNIDTNLSWFIKWIISISTIILVCLVIFYHYFNFKLYATQNSLDHWRVGISFKRIIFIILEIVICAIHPIPRDFPENSLLIHEDINRNSTISNSLISPSFIAIDVALGLPMFARLYLISRCLMFHSHLVLNAPSKSLGSFNQISINFTFIFKTYLEQWPARCLIISCCIMFFIGSWSIRACDYKQILHKHISMVDSMWLFIITFTTVGYGDLTPSTYCGRTVVSIIAIFGLLSSALLISVVAEKLQLTRWEKYVHNFVSDIDLTRKRREQAANVIKFAIQVWYLKRINNNQSLKYFQSQRLLFQSIHYLQKIKYEQRKLNESCLDFIELINIQRSTNIKTKKIIKEIFVMKLTMEKFEEKFLEINQTMNNIQKNFKTLVDRNILE